MPASLKDKVSADMVQNSISQMIEVVRDDSIRQTSGQFSTVIVKGKILNSFRTLGVTIPGVTIPDASYDIVHI